MFVPHGIGMFYPEFFPELIDVIFPPKLVLASSGQPTVECKVYFFLFTLASIRAIRYL